MLKKIFITALIVFIIALSALVAKKIFFDDPKGIDSITADQNGDTSQNKVNDENAKWVEKLIKLVESGVHGATLAGSTSQVLYYQNQRFLFVDFNGKTKNSVGAHPFIDVKSIDWDVKKQKALIKDRNRYYIYNLNDNSAKELNENIDVAVWGAKGSKIIYKYYNPKTRNRVLGMMDPNKDDSEEVIIEDLRYKQINLITSFKKSKVCLFPSPSAHVKENFECYDWRNNKKILEYKGAFGADYLWSHNGKHVLASYLQEKGGKRLLIGAANDKLSEFKGLNFLTSVKKCTWSKDNVHVYCGMLNGMSDLAILPDDWNDEKFYSADTFWRINTIDGKKKRLIDVEKMPVKIDAVDLFLDSSEKYLFFTDRRSGSLYRLAI
ncbi:MAG: hypothetical protein U9M90_01685 [Patescibacteria group bacterium]|nr:hypothetical protein [Patescibacteria group bacterium]